MPDGRDNHPERRAAEIVQARAGSEPLLSSVHLDWRRIAVERLALPAKRFVLPALDAIAVLVHLRGTPEVSCRIGDREHCGQAGAWDATILPPGIETSWTFSSDCDLLCVYLDPALLVRSAAELSEAKEHPPQADLTFLTRDPALSRIAEELVMELQAPGLGTRFFAGTVARLLALHLLRHHSNLSGIGDDAPFVIPPAKLRRAFAFIDEHLDSQISISGIAEVVGMTLYHFAKTFKIATGQSPYRYVTERRIELAKRLLVETDLEIAQIAQRIGLSSQSYFTALFARHTGQTPKRYRDRMQG